MTERTKTNAPGIYKQHGRYVILATMRAGPNRPRRRVEQTLAEGTSFEEARKARAALVQDLERKEKAAQKNSKNTETVSPTTLESYANHWIEVRAMRLKASVKHHYVAVLAMRILPYLGDRPVRELTRGDLEAWIGRMERAERRVGQAYSRHTVHAWFRVLMTLMRDAAADLGFADPTIRLRAPRTDVDGVRETRTLTTSELARLLMTAKDHFPEWYAEIATTAYTGMRPGELYALTWSDLRFDERAIVIRKAVWKGEVSTTKTGACRKSAMIKELGEILREHQSTFESLGLSTEADALVFPSNQGTPRAASSLYKTLGIVASIAGIEQKVGPQVLRRTINTLLVEAGVSTVVVRAQLGHVSEKMTIRYAGIHQEAKVEAVDRLVTASQEDLSRTVRVRG